MLNTKVYLLSLAILFYAAYMVFFKMKKITDAKQKKAYFIKAAVVAAIAAVVFFVFGFDQPEDSQAEQPEYEQIEQ